MSEDRRNIISKVRRLVIKVGSSVLTDQKGELKQKTLAAISRDISELHSRGIQTVVTSSGAIASGMKKLKLEKRPVDIVQKQAIAACGQSTLMQYYEKAFTRKNINVAQVLLTHDGLSDRKRFLYARKTMLKLLEIGIVPIVNENDVVANEEIMFGDNDKLGALVTSLVDADLFIIMTDIEGLYTKDPKNNEDAEIINKIDEITEAIEEMAGGTQGNTSIGGMKTKIEAIRSAGAFGVPSIIVNGNKKGVLLDIFEYKNFGTLFLPSKDKLKGRKHWIVFNLRPSGKLIIDSGAVNAVESLGKSLLPSGITDVVGKFGIGDPVACVTKDGKEIARGITSYSSAEILRIKGLNSSEIENILGYKYSEEVIHRDDMAVIRK